MFFLISKLTFEDAESNPGPWVSTINKAVKALGHQKHAQYREYAGMQYTSSAYIAFTFSAIKDIQRHEGDKIFQFLGLKEPLAFDELSLTERLKKSIFQQTYSPTEVV